SRLVALSPDGKVLAVSALHSRRWRLRMLDIRTKKVLCQTDDWINGGTVFSPDGRMLAIGSQMWRYDGRARQKKFGWYHYPRPVVAFSPDGQLVVSHGNDGIDVWEVASGRWVGPPRIEDEKDEERKPSSYRGRLAAASAAARARVIAWKDSGRG